MHLREKSRCGFKSTEHSLYYQENQLEYRLKSYGLLRGSIWLGLAQTPCLHLAEHLKMMKTTGQNPRPCFSEGWMSEVVGSPTHLLVWHRRVQYRLHVSNWMHVPWVSKQTQAVFRACSDIHSYIDNTSFHSLLADYVIVTDLINNVWTEAKWH